MRYPSESHCCLSASFSLSALSLYVTRTRSRCACVLCVLRVSCVRSRAKRATRSHMCTCCFSTECVYLFFVRAAAAASSRQQRAKSTERSRIIRSSNVVPRTSFARFILPAARVVRIQHATQNPKRVVVPETSISVRITDHPQSCPNHRRV